MSSAVLHITAQTNINRRKEKLTASHPFKESGAGQGDEGEWRRGGGETREGKLAGILGDTLTLPEATTGFTKAKVWSK